MGRNLLEITGYEEWLEDTESDLSTTEASQDNCSFTELVTIGESFDKYHSLMKGVTYVKYTESFLPSGDSREQLRGKAKLIGLSRRFWFRKPSPLRKCRTMIRVVGGAHEVSLSLILWPTNIS